MAYDHNLASRVRERLSNVPKVKEIEMMGGLAFMVNAKMCVGIFKDELMCRIDPERREEALSKPGCTAMKFTGREMKSIVLVDDSGIRSQKAFEYWIGLCLEFNKKARASKRRKKKKDL
jgi:TfoX/Sxy family transcriptional regulator of competence genes